MSGSYQKNISPSKGGVKKNLPSTPSQKNQSLGSHTLIMNTCMKILRSETQDDINKWFIQNKITSVALKSDKLQGVITQSEHVLKSMLIEQEHPHQFLSAIISHYKCNNKKCYEFCRCLKHFAARDYEFDYLLSMAKSETEEPLSFYLACRTNIVESFLNKTKKETMCSVSGSNEQWFGACKRIFRGVGEVDLVEIFADTSKAHYIQIKKNQNQELNGDEFFKICLIMRKIIQDKKQQEEENFLRQRDQQIQPSFDESITSEIYPTTHWKKQATSPDLFAAKEKSVKRLFDRGVLNNLQSEDRDLIRMLSYRDSNIARLLQKKHDKVIELIANEVEELRHNIQEEKKKYIALCKQKDQIAHSANSINQIALSYVLDGSFQNQRKLLENIEVFTRKYSKDPNPVVRSVKEAEKVKKNRRLVELIEAEEKEID